MPSLFQQEVEKERLIGRNDRRNLRLNLGVQRAALRSFERGQAQASPACWRRGAARADRCVRTRREPSRRKPAARRDGRGKAKAERTRRDSERRRLYTGTARGGERRVLLKATGASGHSLTPRGPDIGQSPARITGRGVSDLSRRRGCRRSSSCCSRCDYGSPARGWNLLGPGRAAAHRDWTQPIRPCPAPGRVEAPFPFPSVAVPAPEDTWAKLAGRRQRKDGCKSQRNRFEHQNAPDSRLVEPKNRGTAVRVPKPARKPLIYRVILAIGGRLRPPRRLTGSPWPSSSHAGSQAAAAAGLQDSA